MPSSGEKTVVVAHHPMEIQPWLQMPYPGGTTSLSRDHGHHLEAKEARARSSVIDVADITVCTGERGTCPAWGKECGICRGKNHYKAVCQKAAQMQAGGGAQPKFQKQGKGKSPGKNGKAKAKQAHSVVFKTVPSTKGTVSGLEEGTSASNSVTSEPSVPLSLGVQ